MALIRPSEHQFVYCHRKNKLLVSSSVEEGEPYEASGWEQHPDWGKDMKDVKHSMKIAIDFGLVFGSNTLSYTVKNPSRKMHSTSEYSYLMEDNIKAVSKFTIFTYKKKSIIV